MKKKTVFLKLVSMLLMAFTPPVLAVAETISYTAGYRQSQQTGTDTLGGMTYATVKYGELFNYGAPGTPSLPVDLIRFSVPYNATNFSVTTTLMGSAFTSVNYLLYPCQKPIFYDDTTGFVITLPDSAAYNTGYYYPLQKAWVADEGFVAGENHIVTVAVTPISYLHTATSDKLVRYRNIHLTLHYELSDSLSVYPLVRRDTVLRNEGFELTRNMVVNPDDVRPNSVPVTSPMMHYHGIQTLEPTYSEDSVATYLIVTTQELKHSTRRLAALKRQKGYSVKVVTMNEVLASPYSGDGDMIYDNDSTYHIADTSSAGKLRQYLKYCYHNLGTKYVLLAGTGVPYQTKDLGDDYGVATTDMYYSELNSSWQHDTVEAGIDLFVGRILATTSNQIDNYTDKLFRYELNPGKGNYSYLDSAFFLKGRDVKDYLLYYRDAMTLLSSCYSNTIDIIDKDSNNSGWPTGKSVIDSICHVSLSILFNHGGHNSIRVYGTDTCGRNNYIYALRDMSDGDGLNCLQNKDRPMVFYAPSCKTVPYDNVNGQVFGESFTTGKDYGGPVYIGYTRTADFNPVTEMLYRFAKTITNGFTRLGEADALSKFYANPSCYRECVIHAYIGDPLVDLWTGIPLQFNNASLSRTFNSIKISGIDVDSTIVAYRDEDSHVGYQIVPPTSITLNSVSPNSSIMVYKHNYIPYIAPLALQNINLCNSQYVIASDVTAGNNIDNNRTSGDVVVPNGVEYEIEASGIVTLEDGFRVEKGATFAVYPSCF